MNGCVVLHSGSAEFLNELDKMRLEVDEPALAPLTPQQRKDIEHMGAAEQIRLTRRIREVAHHWDTDARLAMARQLESLIRELSEASAFLRRRRGEVVTPCYDTSSSPFFRRQVGPT